MNVPQMFLLCFAVGALWSFVALTLGGAHGHIGHGHFGHGAHVHAGHGPGGGLDWLGWVMNPSCAAVFLAWFGAVGYLLTRHAGLAFWLDLALAVAAGACGAWILAEFLRFVQAREQPLNPADYEMIGVLGRVASPIRPGGVGEVIYVRDGIRRPVPARSDDGLEIPRGEEVVVTRYERGIAYVRTWEAMVQHEA
jgi:membrane protein implicated in regulation of membrane protease activity